MTKLKIITLLTDFGHKDIYVGVLKGAIARINPNISIIDLTHEIPPQDVVAGKFCLMSAYPHFPEDTIYIAVVDPGVGSKRRGIAVKLSRGYLVGPDNGLFSGLFDRALHAVELNNPQYWGTTQPSQTFHGRDIFAPVGAHLATGVALEELGETIAIESLVKLSLPEFDGAIASIQYIDSFGNLITNIPGTAIINRSWSLVVDKRIIPSCKTYSDLPEGALVALIGSDNWIEIAVNKGNAQKLLNLHCGDKIHLI
jgi:hypothetical protein